MSAPPSKASSPSKPVEDQKEEGSIFTMKERDVLEKAWLCLKSGAPDVDVEKLTQVCGFKTKKTATNTWGVIKKKLQSMAPAAMEAADGDEGNSECSGLLNSLRPMPWILKY